MALVPLANRSLPPPETVEPSIVVLMTKTDPGGAERTNNARRIVHTMNPVKCSSDLLVLLTLSPSVSPSLVGSALSLIAGKLMVRSHTLTL